MFFFTFILGLSLGIAICIWRQIKFNAKLKQLLNSSSNSADLSPELPIAFLVRRELSYLNQKNLNLQSELKNWQDLLDQAPIGYLQVDQENQLVWCNQLARQLLNIEAWNPQKIRLLLELVRSYELDQLIQITRHSQEMQVQEWEFYGFNYANQKQIRSLFLRASSYPFCEGKIAIFIENKQPLVELSQQSERSFSDLTHELRTPLTSISLVAETLEKRLSYPEKKWVDQMLKEIKRLIILVEEWLEITRLKENPSQHLHYELIELKEVIMTSWQTLEPLAKQQEISLDYKGIESLYLQADKSRLIQVFLNLLDNAIKHSPNLGTISVEVELITITPATQSKNESYVQVNIIDSGEGFLDSDLPYVFNRLYRSDNSRSRSSSDIGSGLGLSIVQQIILAHGGEIQAKNHPQTKGAWLQFRLPVV